MNGNEIPAGTVPYAVYQAVYVETFNRLVARSIETYPHLWNVGPYQRPRNGGISRAGNGSRKKELQAIAQVARETARAAYQELMGET